MWRITAPTPSRPIPSTAGTRRAHPIGCSGSSAAVATSAGVIPFSVTVDPSGKFAYVANNGSDDVSAYTITSTGALTPIICSGTCSGLTSRPSLRQRRSHRQVRLRGELATLSNPSTVSAYTIASTGALTQSVPRRRGSALTPSPSTPRANSPTWRISATTTVSAYTIDSTTGHLRP